MAPTYCYKLIVEYDGSRFSGFQRQAAVSSAGSSKSNANGKAPKRPRYDPSTGKKQTTPHTIQSCLEDALVLWDKSRQSATAATTPAPATTFRLRSAGRTDRGVHARGQVVAIDLETHVNEKEEFRQALNSRLPSDICVRHIEQHHETNWQPRLVAIRKQYSYTIRYRSKTSSGNGAGGGVHSFRTAHDSPILWLVPWCLDDTFMDELLEKIQGRHNFYAFCHKEERPKYESHILTLSRFDRTVKQRQHQMDETVAECTFILEAQAFRRSMCRLLVGFVVDVCRGRLDMAVIGQVLDEEQQPSEETAQLIHAAPASGLCLEEVWF